MRRYVPRLIFALAIGWLVTLTVIIWRSPDQGASSPDELARAYETAVAAGDSDAMRRLAPDADADAVRTLLRPPGCPGPRAAVTGRSLVISGRGTACGRLPISRRHGRWVVDAWSDPFHSGQ